MTQNLDFDIDLNETYTDEDSNFDAYYTWTPNESTYVTGDTTWAMDDWDGPDYYIQQSYDPGDKIWDGVPNSLTTLDDMEQGTNMHYHIGNYYSWNAAIADYDFLIGDERDIEFSICPAGWTLPSYNEGHIATGTLSYLVEQYGWNSSNNMFEGDMRPWDAPLYLTLAGDWFGESNGVGAYGVYWTNGFVRYDGLPVEDAVEGYEDDGDFYGSFYPAEIGSSPWSGFSVRCVAEVSDAYIGPINPDPDTY